MRPSPTRLPIEVRQLDDRERQQSACSTSMRASTARRRAGRAAARAPAMNVSVAATCGTAGAMYADATACARAQRELCARSSSTRNSERADDERREVVDGAEREQRAEQLLGRHAAAASGGASPRTRRGRPARGSAGRPRRPRRRDPRTRSSRCAPRAARAPRRTAAASAKSAAPRSGCARPISAPGLAQRPAADLERRPHERRPVEVAQHAEQQHRADQQRLRCAGSASATAVAFGSMQQRHARERGEPEHRGERAESRHRRDVDRREAACGVQTQPHGRAGEPCEREVVTERVGDERRE